ncbi:MAG: hypothetical protein ABI910_22275 [Gemmatimonadota bacterium]
MTDQPQHPRVGERAPVFSLPDLNGALVSLDAQRATRHVVIHFVREFT